MNEPPSDALVVFGATGDLAGKMIFPAVCALAARGALDIPVIAVARHSEDKIKDAVDAHLDACAQSRRSLDRRLARRIRYVGGDLQDDAVYASLKKTLRGAQRPLYYLAIPPGLFAIVVDRLSRAGLASGARIAVEKPFGHDLASARALDVTLRAVFPDAAIFRIDHFLAKDPVRDLVFLRFGNRWLEPIYNHGHVARIEITMAEDFGIAGRGRFYDAVGALRDVFQNHLLQLVALLTMEPPADTSAEAVHAARIAALSSLRTIGPDDVVRGQYGGYRNEADVARDSTRETYIAVRLSSEADRWKDVPILVRAGKCLPLTTTEAWIAFKSLPHAVDFAGDPAAHHLRFRLGPGRVDVGLGAYVKRRGAAMIADPVELAVDLGIDEDRDAYERLIEAALAGDHALDERAEGAFASWRVVEKIVDAELPMFVYARGTFGPAEATRLMPQGAHWHDPARDPALR